MIRTVLLEKGSNELIACLRLIFNEWGKGSFEDKLEKLKQKAGNDKCYAVYDDDSIVATFVVCENDIPGRSDLNPNLACVCVDGKHRGKGYGNIVLTESKKVFKDLGVKRAYLKTTLKNFYEKVGWTYMESFTSGEGEEKIYFLDL